MAASSILGPNGQPLVVSRPRAELTAAFNQTRRQPVEARYDAASSSSEFRNYWANADALDADSANSKTVRQTLVKRSRYEVANNGYADGIVQTLATDTVSVGPKLRMQTGNVQFNQAVERVWTQWAKAIQLRRKLWCMAHAKFQDGESFGVIRTNPRLKTRVKLDVALVETEQCTSWAVAPLAINRIDGIKFDEFGNAVEYEFLQHHPGSQNQINFSLKTETVDAQFVLHWFLLRRPGQHRGVPEFRSTLQVGASSRRWREATVAAAETAADISVWLETNMPPDNEADPVQPLAEMAFQKRMAIAAPMGWSARQVKAEHPNATYEAFSKAQISEFGRPKSMPYNKAACDSSSYNFASGRLDHLTYYAALDVEREDANDCVLEPLFAQFWAEAVLVYGWNADPESPPEHGWDWPRHQTVDPQAEALANDRKLRMGAISLTSLYAEQALDFEDELPVLARDYGVSEDEMRQILRDAIFNAQGQQASMQQAENQAQAQAQGGSNG